MDSLDRYARIFDESYPDYADARYEEIRRLVAIYDSEDATNLIASDDFSRFSALIRPVISAKNYKSQIPFPEDFQAAIEAVIAIRRTRSTGSDDKLTAYKVPFERLLSIQGFQLPTASAFMHFCHPSDFPIVDRNVEAACAYLKQLFPDDFEGVDEPSLPAAATSLENKTKKYRIFIRFLDKIRSLQAAHGGPSDYRYVDKALMVLGVPRLREKADRLEMR
jgi:hypothetical protein